MNGSPFAFSPRSRSGWISVIRNEARNPRIPAPTTPAASLAPNIRSSSLRARRGREMRRDLLEDARDDPRDVLDALREHREHDLGSSGKDDPADEVAEVVGVAGLRPEETALRQRLARPAVDFELFVLEGLLRPNVAGEQAHHLFGQLLPRDLARDDLLEDPRGLGRRHPIAVLSVFAKRLLAAVRVLAERFLVGVQVRVPARPVPLVDDVALCLPCLPLGGAGDLR